MASTLETSAKDARLDIRLPREDKDLVARAAKMTGRKLSEFILSSTTEAAKKVLREYEVMKLDAESREVFVEALLNPAPPNARLRAASERHKQLLGD